MNVSELTQILKDCEDDKIVEIAFPVGFNDYEYHTLSSVNKDSSSGNSIILFSNFWDK